MQIHNREFEEYVRGGSALSQAYARLGKAQVPPELDRKVLAHAAAAVTLRRRFGSSRLAPFALAASVLTCLALAIYVVRSSADRATSRDVLRIVQARATAQDGLAPRTNVTPTPAPTEFAGPIIEFVPPILNHRRVISSDPPGSRPFELDATKPLFYEVQTVPFADLPAAARQDIVRLDALRRDGRIAEAEAAEQAFREKFPDISLTHK